MSQPPPQPPPQPSGTQYGPPPGVAQQTNGMAVAALVSGILGLTIFFGLGSILALIFGYLARGQIKRSQGQQTGNGMAMAGLVMGWIGVVLSIVFIVLIVIGGIALFNFAGSEEFEVAVKEGFNEVAAESLDGTSEAAAGCTGIETYPDMGANHVGEGQPHEPYNSSPPTSGPHYEIPAETGFFEADSGIEPERLVHNLEHGQIVIWYRPGNPLLEQQVEELVAQEPVATVGAPYPDMNPPYNIVMTAWTKARACQEASQEVVDDFRSRFQGRGPEPLTPRFDG